MSSPALAASPPRFLFFTGKGGVGKTSVSTATAIGLADGGGRVLLVSTDAASNLDEMLGVPFGEGPVAVPGVPGLSVWNIDPGQAAEAYRRRVVERMGPGATDAERATVREELSGACTTEIASFDAFAALLAAPDQAAPWDHVVFDTAPTGHTLRLLSLPKAWTGFLAGNDRGASCLGPHSGLKLQEAEFAAALAALSDPARTEVVLVARPDRGSLDEAGRAAVELRALGLGRQRLVVNGVFHPTRPDDPVAAAWARRGAEALEDLPASLVDLPRQEVPLRPFDTVGLPALRAVLGGAQGVEPAAVGLAGGASDRVGAPLKGLVERYAADGHGLLLVMGKGGVGKTTVAAALAVGLARRGQRVLLTTTDPAGHVAGALQDAVPGLSLGRIDPAVETEAYIARQLALRGKDLDEAGRALLLEDLRSPCTEEVAVFHAFSRVVNLARSQFVVLDTAPTGHSLLLMDATGAYHRQITRGAVGRGATHLVTPLMRLQDPSLTHVVLVTLPETTPVSQAAALQEDLRRAGVEPCAWVVNESLAAAGVTDPLLAARVAGERRQIARIAAGLAPETYVVPWCAEPPVDADALGEWVGG